MEFRQYDCYVDASVKDDKRSFAVVITKNGKKVIELSQQTKAVDAKGINTTELLAAVYAMSELLRLKRDGAVMHRVVIHTDSDYVYTTMTRIFYIYENLADYESKSLLSAAYVQLRNLQDCCKIDFVKVKGHECCVLHNRAHELAYKALSGEANYVRYAKDKQEIKGKEDE